MPVSLTVGQSLSGISQTAPVRSVLMAGAVFALAGKGFVGHTHSVSSPGGLVEFACQPEVGDYPRSAANCAKDRSVIAIRGGIWLREGLSSRYFSGGSVVEESSQSSSLTAVGPGMIPDRHHPPIRGLLVGKPRQNCAGVPQAGRGVDLVSDRHVARRTGRLAGRLFPAGLRTPVGPPRHTGRHRGVDDGSAFCRVVRRPERSRDRGRTRCDLVRA